MPFVRESMHNDNGKPTPEAEAETTFSRPLPIHRMDHSRRQRQTPIRVLNPKLSEESIRTDLCEGPLQDEARPRTPEAEPDVTTTSDRAELIEWLKRGESPTWVPNRRHESFVRRKESHNHSPGLLTASLARATNEADLQQSQEAPDVEERLRQGLNMERPRSALHSGDFHPEDASRQYMVSGKPESTIREADVFHSDLASSWYATSPPRDFSPFKFERRILFPDLPDGYKSSPPSLSSSLSSSFVYKHPTSPLVQSESNDDLNINAMDLDPGTPTRAPRRQTLHTFSRNMPATAQRIPSMRRQSTFPYQAHQPRKSLTSAPAFPPTGSPPASLAGSRRLSVALDSSPLQRTSMVGSYEESILRGRMSTTPSKPLDFMAQIGVLGLGNCKPSLKCPAHVTLPFPAVFYSYASTPHGRSAGDDGPSPYVGQIDLENGLPAAEDARARRKSRQRGSSIARSRQNSIGPDTEMTGVGAVADRTHARDIAKHCRRRGGGGGGGSSSSSSSSSPKAPPGGSYRIPEKGQIQIIIKNQNKTAVKLFLVPYDLAGMEPGTKTFLRQRSYTGGPVAMDGGASATTTTTTTSTTTNIATAPSSANGEDENNSSSNNNKQVLRYLVHLHICSPTRGRYYLYKSIRVVFANRVPDGKERMRNEITLPEPRFTPYKPAVRQMLLPPANPPSQSSASFSFALLPPPSSSSASAPGFAPLDFAKGGAATAAGSAAGTAEGLLSLRLRGLGMQGAGAREVDDELGKNGRR